MRFYHRWMGACLVALSLTQASGQALPPVTAPKDDPFLSKVWWSLNDSPMQQKLRSLKPYPVSVVYYQQMDHDFEGIKKEFQYIKDNGFTALKQVMLRGKEQDAAANEKVFKMALDLGISPWYYGMGGWDPITPELLKKLGIKTALSEANLPTLQKDPKIWAYQTDMLKKRAENMKNVPPLPMEFQFGEPGRGNPFMSERLIPRFSQWLKDQYKTLDGLNKAWFVGYTSGYHPYTSFEEAAAELKGTGLDEYGRGKGKLGWDLKRYIDAMRFQAELAVGDYERAMQHYIKYEPNEPKRTGAHQLFENQAFNGWDFEGQAHAAAIGGSFYASVHLAHHFFLTEGEVTRPAYMQARIIADNFKGGWAATWESTGGPTQWSGTHSFTVDGPMVSRLMTSYIAAGLKGIGFWTWNSRDVGWEFGEYALTNLQGKATDRSRTAAAFAKALDRERFELWEALDEPVVGVLYSWDNEAMLGRLSMGSYPLATRAYPKDRDPEFAQFYSQSRIGISRALMNNNIPFEYVSDRELKKGLAGRYKVIYLPYMLTLPEESQKILEEYVRQGGHVVADMPLWFVDENGVMNKYKVGERFERLFGFQVQDYYHSFNEPLTYAAAGSIQSQFAELVPTSAQVLEKFAEGRPAVLQNKFGKGTATVFNFEASRLCAQPGAENLEKRLAQSVTEGKAEAPYTLTQGKAMVMRRSAPKADHLFFLNEGGNQTITLKPGRGISYASAYDAVNAENKVSVGADGSLTLTLPAKQGVWVRAVKK